MPRRLILDTPFRSLLLGLVLMAAAAGAASAQALDDLASSLGAASPLVVTGRVVAIQARWDTTAAAIYTYVTVDVTDQLKGQLDNPRLVIKQLGGQVGDVGLRVDDQAAFTIGEDVLVFLAVRPRDGTLYPAGFELGKWRLVPDLATGQTRAVPSVATAAPLAGPAAAGATPGLDLPTLRGIVAATPVPAGAFVSAPAESGLAGAAYAYLPTGGFPARWHQVDDSVPIEVQTQTPPGGEQALLGGAMSLWSNAGTRLRLQFAGSGPVPPTCSGFNPAADRRIWLFYNDPCGEISDADPNTFGVGGGFFTSGDRRTINGTTFDGFVQGIAVVNNVFTNRGAPGCLQAAITHVLGHAIGLGDTTSGGAIMRATLPGGCTGGAPGLGADDVNGIRAIYPNTASGPTPPQPPTGFGSTVMLSTVTLHWTPAGSGGPASSYLVDAGTAPGLTNIGTFTVPASMTSLTVNDVPAGVYYARVRARNVLGTSAPSAEAAIVVGSCAAPGMPASFQHFVADQAVNLAWAPSATGGPTQGYVLAVGSAPGITDILSAPYPASVTSVGTIAPYGDYYVRLFATNVCGVSPPTPDVLVRVQPCTAAPGAPTTLAFTQNGAQVAFTWTAPATGSAPSTYVIVVGSVSGGADQLVYNTGSPATGLAAVGPPGTYYVRVYAANACGGSGFSNEVKVVIP